MIPLSVPTIQGNEWRYIKDCLDSEWVSSAGQYVDKFEEKVCEYTGAGFAVACVNGTSALQVALLLAGVKSGDEVIVPTLTFIAPVNAVRYVNAEPVFMDCDEYYNIDVSKTIQFIENETRMEKGYTVHMATCKRITAIVPVHIFGNAANLEALLEICLERNIRIVEDATESIGTRYNTGTIAGRHCGTIGQVGCLSFNGNKMMTTGGGGMILTDDSDLATRAKYLTTQAKDDAVRYVHNEIGFNFRLTNIQAAMGLAQLEQLPGFLETKKRTYKQYQKGIQGIPGLQIAAVPNYANNNHWMVALQIENNIYGKDREALMAFLAEKQIQTRPVWYLNHLQKPYLDCPSVRIVNALALFDITLNIPCSTNIVDHEIEIVLKCLNLA